jgi:hypothetical protein
MRRGTIVLFIFVLAAVGIIAASTLLQNQPPFTMTIAVDPLIEDWAREVVNRFNGTNPVVGAGRRVQFAVTVVDDVRVWNGATTWTSLDHPHGWLAASSLSVEFARSRSISTRTVVESVARTPLVIGGYVSRVDILTDEALTWEDIAAAAEVENWEALGGQANWRFVKLAFSLPDQTISGLSVLLSAVANFQQTTQITGAEVNNTEFRNQFTPIVRSVSNFNSIGQDAAAYTARGTASVDIAFAPESQWLHNLNGILRNEDIVLSYPEYPFVFDFPLVQWDDSTTTDDERRALDRLGEWMLNTEQQSLLPDDGLRPVTLTITSDDSWFSQAEAYGLELNPNFDNVIEVSGINDAQSLIRWFQSIR